MRELHIGFSSSKWFVKESSEKRLEEAVSQVLKQDYGKQHHVQELNRMVLIYSLQGREFVKWQLVD